MVVLNIDTRWHCKVVAGYYLPHWLSNNLGLKPEAIVEMRAFFPTIHNVGEHFLEFFK